VIPEFSGDFIQWLRGFYYTAQTGSMTAATAIMNRNQSALAHQVKCLEQEFGVKLFTGNKTKRKLTEEGKFLLEKSINIFELINSIRQTISALPDTLSGEISIAAAYTAVQYYLPEIVAIFGSHYPKVSFRFLGHASRQAILEAVRSRTADLGILCTESAPNDLRLTPLFSTEVMCVSPKNGPYAVTNLLNLEQLANFPCFFPPESSTMEPFLDIQFNRFGLKLKNTHEVNHFEAAKVYVRMGMGITFIDKFACSETDFQNLTIISMSKFFPPRVFSVLHRTNMFIPSHLDAFLKCLKDNSKHTPRENES
jgi:DNA-binding transcriptional LysR family regulator